MGKPEQNVAGSPAGPRQHCETLRAVGLLRSWALGGLGSRGLGFRASGLGFRWGLWLRVSLGFRN